MLILKFINGPLKNKSVKILATSTFGSLSSCDVSIKDPSLLPIHFEIKWSEGIPVIKDLSSYGIKLNNNTVDESPLKCGDIIQAGQIKMLVTSIIIPEEPAQVATKFYKEQIPTYSTISGPLKKYIGRFKDTVEYRLINKISEGGMGTIYEAEQIGIEGFIKRVAIKTIIPKHRSSKDIVNAFVTEAKLAASLVHQNIVQILQLGKHENTYFIVMEYIDGINLSTFMSIHKQQEKLLPVDLATFIVSRIARALEYAHNKRDEIGRPLNIVHRDVSPNNILISREGEVKLTDFGVAKAKYLVIEDDPCLVGNPEYMSPEQASCKDVDHRSDIFSLGLIYYELLTGHKLFKCIKGNIENTLKEIQQCKIPSPLKFRKDIPGPIVDLIMKCLEKNRDDRIPSAGILAYALESEMYSKGYGPTILTMADYLREIVRLQSF